MKSVLFSICEHFGASSIEVLPGGEVFAVTPAGRVFLAGIQFHVSAVGYVHALPPAPLMPEPERRSWLSRFYSAMK